MMEDPRLWAGLGGVGLVLLGAALARWRAEAAMAIPLALLLALAMLLGGILASPRQLGERLPMLALILCGPAVLATVWSRRWVGWASLGLAGLLGGWWMSGGGLNVADLARAWPVLVAVGLAGLFGGAALGSPWLGAMLPAGLAGLLWAAAPPGPWADAALPVALIGLATLAYRPTLPAAGRIALGPMLAALAAGPVIALGRPADIAVAGLLAAVALVGLASAGWQARAIQAALFAGGAAMLALIG